LTNFLILVDETIDENSILKLKNLDGLIITFDISSHHRLSELKISHKLVENYISDEIITLIENESLEKARNWYRFNNFEKTFNLEGLNLGSVIEDNIFVYLLQKLKIILGVKKILETEKPKKVSSTFTLLSIVKFFATEDLIFNTLFSTSNLSKDTEKVILPISIGKKSYNFWIPKNFALNIAKVIESTSSIFYGLNFDFKKMGAKPSTILLDLNPRPYQILLNELSNDSKNLIIMKDVGPILWNKENIDIIKKSNSKILGLDKFKNNNLNILIKDKQGKLNHKLKKIFSNDFDNFSTDGVFYWELIRDEFFIICDQKFQEAIKIFELSKEFFKKMNVTNILTLYNSDLFQQIFLHIANKNNIPSIRLQHGFDPLNDYLKLFLPLSLPEHQSNLKHGLWGIPSKNYLLKSTFIKNDQSIVLGNPRYDVLPLIKKQSKKSNTIILASSYTYTGFDLSGFDSNLSELHKKTFKEVCKTINQYQNKKLVVKFHPRLIQTSYSIQPILNEINPNIQVFKTQNIFELFKDCDVLVCLDFSSVLLEALILGKPIILFMINSTWYQDDPIITSGSVLTVKSLNEFEDALNLILNDQKTRTELIENGKKFVSSYLSNLGTSSKYLAKIIDKS
jgi:glycosyltransferase involved in cell wall biosynthesis